MENESHPPNLHAAVSELVSELDCWKPIFPALLASAVNEGGEADHEKYFDVLRRARALRARVADSSEIATHIDALINHATALERAALDSLRHAWRAYNTASRAKAAASRGIRDECSLPAQDVPEATLSRAVRAGSKSARMRNRIAEILGEQGVVHRSVLLERLTAEGLLGTERKPVNRLASILSDNRHIFGSDGKGSYVLLQSEPTSLPPSSGKRSASHSQRRAKPPTKEESGAAISA